MAAQGVPQIDAAQHRINESLKGGNEQFENDDTGAEQHRHRTEHAQTDDKTGNDLEHDVPTVMLATSRTVRLKGLESREMASIGTTSGASTSGMPLGINVRKYPHFRLRMPTATLNSSAAIDSVPTAVACEVKVKA